MLIGLWDTSCSRHNTWQAKLLDTLEAGDCYVGLVWGAVLLTWIGTVIVGRKPIKKGLERLPVWCVIALAESIAIVSKNAHLFALFLLTAVSLSVLEVVRILPKTIISHLGWSCAAAVAWLSVNCSVAFTAFIVPLLVGLFCSKREGPCTLAFLAPALYGLLMVLPFTLLRCANSLPVIVVTLMLVHTADISAGFTGKIGWGRPFPELSPNKTWSGLIGSAVCVIGMSLFLTTTALSCSIFTAIAIGLAAWAAAVVGDLAGSKIKRLVVVKDFSAFLGPHGGIADRTDSLLVSAPLTLLLVSLV